MSNLDAVFNLASNVTFIKVTAKNGDSKDEGGD